MKLSRYFKITGKIEVITGLHIGAGAETIEIGGIDNPVIKHPITNEPYIPGSSLKGKIRSLLEWYLGKVSDDGNVHKCSEKNCEICKIFGVGVGKEENWEEPTRVIFRDCFLSNEYKDDILERGLSLVEEKRENTINRITSKANPRQMERVPAGAIFDFELVYRVFDKDDENNLFETLKKGLALLQKDYLGGSGSRGYGKILFKDLVVDKGNGKEKLDLSKLNL